MKKQGGFTLIELVVVIVILGILAVTAAPRFLNLQSDARESSLQGLKGAMAGAGSIVYGKAAIEGKERLAGEKLEDETEIEFGYPAATENGIVSVVQGLEDDSEWNWALSTDASAATPAIVVTFAGDPKLDETGITDTNCFVTYSEAANSASTSSIEITDSGC
ncbi:MSHA biogenesis protein MshA [Vibrio breoganii]|uniref:MSHA biogenesis protein MshA n=1 Tax=Vibrio breoganii TaxID=553239 RepID=A0AAN1CSR9_9VIBR|nr:prepilin-type N-terminal cleavage/methylation domain-containing protein [Vibrio breoganii]ANO33815.1 MSHA biogenesis protein MshA [Vibrio breoganii]